MSEYVDGYPAEDESLTSARARAEAIGCAPVSPVIGAALRFLATILQAKAVVEIGTGTGVSGLSLLRGMAVDGVLTSIDVDPEIQAHAKRTFSDAGVAPSRTRLIMGRALDVLPRLTDGGYDLLFADAAKPEYPSYHDQGVRLLRPGGVLAFDNVGAITDTSRDDAETAALREVAKAIRDDDRLVPLLLPLGDGLLVAGKIN
jgi:predicted O-methyltransferase YrrM